MAGFSRRSLSPMRFRNVLSGASQQYHQRTTLEEPRSDPLPEVGDSPGACRGLSCYVRRMTKIVISTTTLALSLFAAAATAANPPTAGLHDPAVANAGRQIRSSAIRAHMAFLADDLLEGRGTATRGYEIAAHYVASQLDAAGLEPGVNGAWFQRVPMRRGVLID